MTASELEAQAIWVNKTTATGYQVMGCGRHFHGEKMELYVPLSVFLPYTQAAIAAAIQVKPLEWDGVESDCFVSAHAEGVDYELSVTDTLERSCDYIWRADAKPTYGKPLSLGGGSFVEVVHLANQQRAARILSALSIPPGALAALDAVKAQVQDETDERAARIIEALTAWPVRNQPEKWPDYLRSRKRGDELLAKRAAAIRVMKGGE